MISNKKLKAAGTYSLVSYLGQALNVVIQFLIRKILSPTEMGNFAFLKLLYGYLSLEHGGIRFALDRELLLSDKEEQPQIERTGFALALFFSLITALISFLIILLIYKESPEIWLAFLILDFAALWSSYANFKKAIFRAKENIRAMIFFAAIQPTFLGLFTMIGLLIFGYWGLIGGYFIANITIYIFFNAKYRNKIVLRTPDREISKRLFKVGLPMLGNAFLSIMSNSIDRWIVLAFYGIEILGVYSTASMFMGFAMLLPNTISEVFFPRILRYTKENNLSFVKRFNKMTIALVCLNLLASLAIAFVIPFAIKILIPKYVTAITASIILIFVTAPNMLISLCSYALVGFMKQQWIILLNGLNIGLSIFLAFIFKFMGISGMALAVLISKVVISLFFYLVVIIINSGREYSTYAFRINRIKRRKQDH